MATPAGTPIFEAPASHEATHYSNPEQHEWETHFSNPEQHEAHFSNPEQHESPYSSPEQEFETQEDESETHFSTAEQHEWETPYSNPEQHESAYSPEASGEDEQEGIFGNILGALGLGEDYSNPEDEWEVHEDEQEGIFGNILGALGLGEDYSNPEDEWAAHEDEWETHFSNPEAQEWEDESDPFFGGLVKRGLGALKNVARKMAPIAFKSVASMIPGGSALTGMLGSLLGEVEAEVEAMEASLFGAPETAEVSNNEMGHEAALTELLAAEATEAESESEAEAVLAATLPITITIMGGRRALRPVLPTLAQANSRLVRTLGRQGPAGRQLLRAVPAIQRRAVGTIRAAARRGQPITGPLAVRAMATAAGRVLGSPRQVQRIVVRNSVLRRRTAPPNVRRTGVFMPSRVAPANPRRARMTPGPRF